MAARRSKNQARRNGSSGLPGWAWLVIGILVTLLVVLAAPRLLKPGSNDGFLRIGPKPNPDALPAAVNEDSDAIAPDVATDAPADPAATKPKPTQYDFYTLLPGQEVAMSDAELAASAKAEAEAQARATQAAAQTADAGAAPGLPKPIAESPATGAGPPATTTTKPADAASAGTTATAAPAAAAASNDAHYILQAGAFGASGDAEAVKAKIAMLGLNARVESARIGGKTVYRVRMGPYGSASELAEAKSKLAGGGLPAMAVKTN
ncbi:MAG: sporulation protein [Lysobacteraceae bacterium]|nr:MAG: sporulation protein [Xanthomonadaceae bacterium]